MRSGIASLFLLALLMLALPVKAMGTGKRTLPWAVYYSDKAHITAFEPFQLLVLDSTYHPPLKPLIDRGKTVLGYISLGEVGQHRTYFEDVKHEGLLGEENSVWKGSYAVDLRDARWSKRVVESLIPALMQKGFRGLFLDTLDIAIHLEEEHPKKYAGMKAAAARLVRTIKYHYPHLKVMMNRAYALVPLVGDRIDFLLGESVRAQFDEEKKNYRMVENKGYQWQVDQLRRAKKMFPHLTIMTLDYWFPQDVPMIKQIYKIQRENGFHPYVATVKLDKVMPRYGGDR